MREPNEPKPVMPALRRLHALRMRLFVLALRTVPPLVVLTDGMLVFYAAKRLGFVAGAPVVVGSTRHGYAALLIGSAIHAVILLGVWVWFLLAGSILPRMLAGALVWVFVVSGCLLLLWTFFSGF